MVRETQAKFHTSLITRQLGTYDGFGPKCSLDTNIAALYYVIFLMSYASFDIICHSCQMKRMTSKNDMSQLSRYWCPRKYFSFINV